MARITRFVGNLKAFASAALAGERTIFNNAVATSDDLTANIIADFFRGWGVIGLNGIPPKQWFNAVGFAISQLVAYLFQMGVAEWDNAQEYYIGSITQRSGSLYIAVANNTGVDPATDTSYLNWSPCGGSALANRWLSVFDLTNPLIEYSSLSLDTSGSNTDPVSIAFSADGLSAYLSGSDKKIYQYKLADRNDISTGSVLANFDLSLHVTGIADCMWFSPDGSKLFVGDGAANSIFKYTLGTPWDITTLVYAQTYTLDVAIGTGLTSMSFNQAGTKLYYERNDGMVHQYSLSSAWDLTTITADGVNYNYATALTLPGASMKGVDWRPDGKRLFLGNASGKTYQFDLSVAWDLSTLTYSSVLFDGSAQSAAVQDMKFSANGTKFYTVQGNGTTQHHIFQYYDSLKGR